MQANLERNMYFRDNSSYSRINMEYTLYLNIICENLKERVKSYMDIISLLRMVFGSIFVLFIPGFAWSFAFFKKEEIDVIERIALSFGLSIALVPLSVFYLNYLFHIKITAVNSFLVIIVLTVIPLVYIHLQSTGKIRAVRGRLGF